MTLRIFRYEVPVDDQWHEHELLGDPIAVACRDATRVEFWAIHDDETPLPPRRRSFMVVGTGHPLPQEWLHHHGTAVVPGGLLVWHLLERTS